MLKKNRRKTNTKIVNNATVIDKVGKFIYWTPRILAIAFILFLALLSLDVISPELTFWQILGALFMHNVPALIMLAVLIVSWKYEIVGGMMFILFGLLYLLRMSMNAFTYNFEWYMLSYSFIVAGPAFLIGIFFIIGWYKKKA